jgi:hypothetical protein
MYIPRTKPEKLIRKMINAKGRRNIRGAALGLLKRAAVNVDHKLLQQSRQIRHRLTHALDKALPNVNPQMIGEVTADLESLWEYGQKLDKQLRSLCRMRLPEDRKGMQEVLVAIEVDQFDYVRLCLRRLRKKLPELYEALDRQTRSPRRRVAQK